MVTNRGCIFPKTPEISFREINYLFNREQYALLNYQATSRIQQKHFFPDSSLRTQQNGCFRAEQ